MSFLLIQARGQRVSQSFAFLSKRGNVVNFPVTHHVYTYIFVLASVLCVYILQNHCEYCITIRICSEKIAGDWILLEIGRA